jgi:hypothetical protein
LNIIWEVKMSEQVTQWLESQPWAIRNKVDALVSLLSANGPQQGRPIVDSISGSRIHNLKELRVSSTSNHAIRILFCFTQNRIALLLVAGDKSNNWSKWYDRAIQQAEEEYDRLIEN